MSDFGALRSLLHDAEPSQEAFERLLGLFRQAGDQGEAERVWLPYALEHVEAWSPDSRQLALVHGEPLGNTPPPWMRLVCGLDVGNARPPAEWLRALLGSSLCANLRAFSHTSAGVNAPEGLLGWIVGSEHLTRLESLLVYRASEPNAGVALAEATRFRLRSLQLYGSAVGDEGAAALARSPAFASLRTLKVWRCGIGDEGVRALAPALGGVEHLNLSSNVFGVEGARALARHPGATWRTLDLSSNPIGDDGLGALVRGGRLRGCELLTLSQCELSDAGVVALSGALSGAGGLEALDLRDNAFGDEGAVALGEADLRALTSLDASGNGIGARGVIALLRGPHLGAVELLDLNSNSCEEDALGDLPGDRPAVGALERLELSASWIGPRLFTAMARTRALGSVKSMRLFGNELGVEGARALGQSPYVGSFTSLDLYGAAMSDEGFAALLVEGGERFGALESLDVTGNGLTDASAQVLPGSGLTRLVELDASTNAIGMAWIEALAGSSVSRTLRSLTLSSTNTGDEVARMLAGAPNLAGLRELVLCLTDVTDVGLRALLEAATLERLITSAPASDETMMALAESSEATRLERLIVGPVRLSEGTWRALATSERLRGLVALNTRDSLEPMQAVVTRLARAGEVLNPWTRQYVIEESK